jgi:hypothetical protein
MAARIHIALLLGAALSLTASQAVAGHLPGERHIFRTIGAVAGTFGGAALGVTIGDAAGGNNYTRNVTTGLVVGGIGGGVGGFFLGRWIDKSRARRHQSHPQKSNRPDKQKISEAQARAMDLVTKEFAARLRQPASSPAAEK